MVGPAGMSNPPPPRTTGTGVTSPTSTSQGAWVLQAGEGPIVGPYLPATPETVSWGWVRGGGAIPALTVDPGTVLTVDTISHEVRVKGQPVELTRAEYRLLTTLAR